MDDVKYQLEEIEKILKQQNPSALAFYQEGLSEDQLVDKLSFLGFPAYIISDLYRWRNGVNETLFETKQIQDLELFPNAIFLSIENAIKVYNIYTNQEKLWEEKYFPVFTDGGGSYFVIDLDPSSLTHQKVFLYSPSLFLGDHVESVYDSVLKMVKTVRLCFENRAYYFDDKYNSFEADYDLRKKISARENPDSDFWRN